MSTTAQTWQAVLTGMTAWRQDHPHATFHEIETALDAHLARLRAQMLQDAALATPLAAWPQAPLATRPTCPHCRRPLRSRGTRRRRLQAPGGQEVVLDRFYGTCRVCRVGFFPPR
jgi:hypothetical protein